MYGQTDLIRQVHAYLPDADISALDAACAYAIKAHDGQKRASGEPYITHPIEVAGILADMRLDVPTIQTALLHDTVEDTKATTEDIQAKFGAEVAMLVNGVTKLTRIESQTVEGKQAENFRKLVLAMSEDIRILLVKLADRLHNMRTLHHFTNEDKQKRIARETMEIYAPLAERIGLHKIKEELEDLAFAIVNPEARDSIANRLSFLRAEGQEVVKTITTELKGLLRKAGVPADITGREKTRYSIWRKMQRKNVAFEQLSDLMAFRVVVDTVEQCYHALGIIHGEYPTVPGRFKDYISTPKPNGYRSIHTTVIGPDKHRIEVQIRTKDMHTEADLGVAAHWGYKQGSQGDNLKDVKKYRWLRELLDIVENEQKPEDFLENTKLELFQDQVYVFSPKGDLIELPAGATPIDFAYAIHSGLGDRCVGAKINGRIAPLNTKLANGDSVDVITNKNGNPSPTWERFVVTGKAKSHIRRYVRVQQRDEYITLGRAMLTKLYQSENYEFVERAVSDVMTQFRVEAIDDLYAGIGSGNIVAREVFKAVFPAYKPPALRTQTDAEATAGITLRQQKAHHHAKDGATPLPIKGLIPGMAVHFARCCHPLPGDRIVGIVTHGKGVTVHTIDCETLENYADTPERWLDVSWGDAREESEAHVGRLNITIANQPGALGSLSTVISRNNGNITNLKVTYRSQEFWDMAVDIFVNDTKHLNNVIAALRATPQITSVERTKGR